MSFQLDSICHTPTTAQSTVSFEYSAHFIDSVIDLGATLPPHLLGAHIKRKCEFLAGRLAASTVLNVLDPSRYWRDLALDTQQLPVWPSGFQGSISHTKQVACCLLSNVSVGGIGIDTELVFSEKTARAVTPKILNADELMLIKPFENMELWGTIAFSCKEAWYKAIYPYINRVVGFDTVSIVHIDPSTFQISLMLNRTLHANLIEGQLFTAFYTVIDFSRVETRVLLTV